MKETTTERTLLPDPERVISLPGRGVLHDPGLPNVLTPISAGLGDVWAACCQAIRMAHRTRTKVGIYNGVPQYRGDDFREHRIPEILSLLEGGHRLVATSRHRPTAYVDEIALWRNPYFPTYNRWSPDRAQRKICVAVDPHTFDLAARPDSSEASLIYAGLPALGFQVVTLHGQMTLEQAVNELATAAAFMGTSSGFTHVAHSVGTPILLVRGAISYYDIYRYHVGKAYTLVDSWADAIKEAQWL